MTSTKCPEVPKNGCSICGEGKCVTDPQEVVTSPGQPPVSCVVLQIASFLDGLSEPSQRESSPELSAEHCDCETGEAVPTTTPSILPNTTPCPRAPLNGCSVCGEGLCVTDPQGVISYPGQPPASCDTLEVAGGLLDPSQCESLPELVAEACEWDTQIPGPQVRPILDVMFNQGTVTIFAHGQTGSGKT